jgi:hypothetical protein
MSQPKALDLFQAYSEGKLPDEGGYIISSFFSQKSTYTKYEVVAFAGVKNIYLSGENLTFQTDGNKLFILVEPATYPKKYIEPFRRTATDNIPHRFSELEIYTAKNQTKVMISKEPIMTYSSFTILKSKGINFSLLIYNLPDAIDTIQTFFQQSLNKEAGVPAIDAKKAAGSVISGIKKFTII